MSLEPSTYQEFLARKKRQDKRRREAVKKYRDKVRDEVLSGERESGLKRSEELKPVNPERKKKRFREAYESEERVRFTHDAGCVVGVECYGRMHAHHVTSRGAGGGPDDLVCLCERHHREVHRIGRETFEKKYAISLAHEAAYLSGLWAKHTEDG